MVLTTTPAPAVGCAAPCIIVMELGGWQNTQWHIRQTIQITPYYYQVVIITVQYVETVQIVVGFLSGSRVARTAFVARACQSGLERLVKQSTGTIILLGLCYRRRQNVPKIPSSSPGNQALYIGQCLACTFHVHRYLQTNVLYSSHPLAGQTGTRFAVG